MNSLVVLFFFSLPFPSLVFSYFLISLLVSFPEEEEALPSVKFVYEDGIDYQRTFAPLVQAEADYDKQMKEGQKLVNVKLRWEVGLNRRRLAYFLYARDEGCSVRLATGDEVKISTSIPKASFKKISSGSSSSNGSAESSSSSVDSSAASCSASGRGSAGSSSRVTGKKKGSSAAAGGGAGGGEEEEEESGEAGGLVEWSCTGSITRFAEDSEEMIVELKKPASLPVSRRESEEKKEREKKKNKEKMMKKL